MFICGYETTVIDFLLSLAVMLCNFGIHHTKAASDKMIILLFLGLSVRLSCVVEIKKKKKK